MAEETKPVEKKDTEIKYHIYPTRYFTFNSSDRTWELEIHLPGVKKENIRLRFLNDNYDLYATRDEAEFSISECFPFEIDLDSIEAKYENGLLTVKGKIKDPMSDAYEIKLD